MWNGQLGRLIFHTSTFSSEFLFRERLRKDNPEAVTELNEASGNEITSIGSEVIKAVIASVKKKAQNCIQSGGHNLKNVVFVN